MKQYWFRFNFKDSYKAPYGTIMGCGVTAFNYDDALDLLNKKIFKGQGLPEIKEMIEDIDVSTLDSGHILPNMSAPNIRGVWFPLGFEH